MPTYLLAVAAIIIYTIDWEMWPTTTKIELGKKIQYL